jgi:hypothetical protein
VGISISREGSIEFSLGFLLLSVLPKEVSVLSFFSIEAL